MPIAGCFSGNPKSTRRLCAIVLQNFYGCDGLSVGFPPSVGC